MANTAYNTTHTELERVNLAELSGDERALVELLSRDQRFFLGRRLAGAPGDGPARLAEPSDDLDSRSPGGRLADALGVTPARAAELVESVKARAMSKRKRRRGLPVGQYARHRRMRLRREASR